MNYQLRIAHLYPEHMNIYGDRGNIISLIQRCAWRGIKTELVPVGIGADVDWATLDIVFFGGGQDSGQDQIAEDFIVRQGAGLRAAIEDGLVLLAICGGYQMLGHYFVTHTGNRIPGIGAIDIHTVGGDVRLIGNIVIETSEIKSAGVMKLVGFENHSGRTFLGPRARPLGRVLVGHGNNGEDKSEGAVYHNAMGCYMHGSLLPKNPQLADHLISLALERRYGPSAVLGSLDDQFEVAAQHGIVERLLAK